MQRNTKTKLVWTVTPAGAAKDGIDDISEIIINHNIGAVRSLYSSYSKNVIKELRQKLTECNEKDPLNVPTVSFLLEFSGRKALTSLPGEKLDLKTGEHLKVTLSLDLGYCAITSNEGATGDHIQIKVSCADQISDLKVGSNLLISYGYAELEITKIIDKQDDSLTVECVVLEGGTVENGMKVHSPDMPRNLFPLTPEDESALEDKFSYLADYIVVHGIQSIDELNNLKKHFLGNANSSARHPSVPVSGDMFEADAQLFPRFLFKIDSAKALALYPSIVDSVDGLYLSRSELSVDTHPHDLPIIQKNIISDCNKRSKIVVVASDLMFSMKSNPNPTRAEVSDMSNAVEDGADALVLSSEITHGPHKKYVAEFSREVLIQAELRVQGSHWDHKTWSTLALENLKTDDDLVTYGAMRIASEADVKNIVCFTEGGYTAFRLSSLRTPTQIIALTYNKRIMRQMALLRGVAPFLLSTKLQIETLLVYIKELLVVNYGFKKGDKFVFVSLTSSSVSARNSNLFTLQEID